MIPRKTNPPFRLCLPLAAFILAAAPTTNHGPLSEFGDAAASLSPPPQQRGIEIRDWSFQRTGTGQAAVTSERPFQGRPTLHIRSDVQSTAWAGSPAVRLSFPYSVTWYVLASSDPYNGFIVYDGVDASGAATDIRVYFHDDRGDRSAREGWRGFLWVSDSRGIFSVASIARGQWVKMGVERVSDSLVNLLVNDRVVGQFGSRSRAPLARIGRLGDTMPSWHRGEAFWSLMTVSASSNASSGAAEIPPDFSVSPSEISIQPGSEVTEGQQVKISAIVRNGGSQPQTTRVVINVSETGTGLFDRQVAIPGRGAQTVEALWTAAPSGTYSIFVSVNPFQRTEEANTANNSASKRINVSSSSAAARTSGIEHSSEDIFFTPGAPSPGDTVSITAGVENTGSPAKTVRVYFWCLYPGMTTRRLIAYTQEFSVPARGRVEPAVNWTVPTAEEVEIQTEVHLQTDVVARGTKTLPIGLPDLGLGPSDIAFSPDAPNAFDITPVTVEATVHNFGSKEERIWAVFTFQGGREFGRQLVTVPPKGSADAAVEAGRLSVGQHTIQVELTSAYAGATATREATIDNNRASRWITVLSAPDPSIVRFVVTPADPREGEIVDIQCEVANAGGTRTSFDLEILARSAGGRDTIIGNYTIGPLAPGPPPTHIIRTSWKAVPYRFDIIAQIDPENIAVEKSEDNNRAVRAVTVSFDATTVTASGRTFAEDRGDTATKREDDITKAWVFSKADGLKGPKERYSSLTAADYKVILVPGTPGEECRGDLIVDVWYAGAIDRLTSGVSAFGGEMGDYLARVLVGVRPNRVHLDPRDGFYTMAWESKTDLFGEAVLSICKVVLGAAVGAGVGECWGQVAGSGFEVGYAVLETGRDTTSCDDEVRRTERFTFRNIPFIGGQDYQVYVGLKAVTKAVAVGMAVGYSEVDFYNRSPGNCDSDGTRLKTRGLKVRDVRLVLH